MGGRLGALVALVALAIGVLDGCATVEPDFPVSAITFDEGLVGVWEFTNRDGVGERVRIEERPLGVSAGRVASGSLFRAEVDQPVANPSGLRGYSLTEDNAGDRSAALLGYLVKLDDHTNLFGAIPNAGNWFPLGFSVPMHVMGRVERTGDEMRITMPRVMIAWVPQVRWVDEAPARVDGEFAPAVDPDANGRIYITNSIDRVLAIFRRYGADESFWDGSMTQTLRRVRK
jgi:hypothetical protein